MSSDLSPVLSLEVSVCPRCAANHGDVEFRTFALGDASFTHWGYCPATGEPLLVSLKRREGDREAKFWVRFEGTGKKAQHPANPRFPDGVDIGAPPADGSPSCVCRLPYPAKEIGAWKVQCTECGAKVGCTAAGRADDPRSITILCGKPRGATP